MFVVTSLRKQDEKVEFEMKVSLLFLTEQGAQLYAELLAAKYIGFHFTVLEIKSVH